MKITLQDIQKKFDALESGVETREDIANFASRAMKSNDAGSLEMDRVSARKIWEAILYLSGVDLRATPDRYLHCIQDFMEMRKQIGV